MNDGAAINMTTCWRKRGLIPFNSYARVAEPVDLGCAEREVSCER